MILTLNFLSLKELLQSAGVFSHYYNHGVYYVYAVIIVKLSKADISLGSV